MKANMKHSFLLWTFTELCERTCLRKGQERKLLWKHIYLGLIFPNAVNCQIEILLFSGGGVFIDEERPVQCRGRTLRSK